MAQDRREAKLKEEIEKHRKENPKITEQFADLKRKLSEISEDEWQAIPEIGDYTIKNKQKRQSFAPVPDTLLAQVTMLSGSTPSVCTLFPAKLIGLSANHGPCFSCRQIPGL